MKNKDSINIQEQFFSEFKKTKNLVDIFLVNGLILKGRIIKTDNFSLLIEINNKKALLYKHSIAYIK